MSYLTLEDLYVWKMYNIQVNVGVGEEIDLPFYVKVGFKRRDGFKKISF